MVMLKTNATAASTSRPYSFMSPVKPCRQVRYTSPRLSTTRKDMDRRFHTPVGIL